MKYDRSETLQKLNDSLEMRDARRRALIYGIVWSVLVPAALGTSLGRQDGTLLTVGILVGIIVVICLICWRSRRNSILRSPETYYFYTVTLDQPHGAWRDQVYFTVELKESDGSSKTVNTRAIFSLHDIIRPRMEDYINKTVTVAYNIDTNMTVVIG